MEAAPLAGTWHARILGHDGTVRGAGITLTDRHVLTCAHVVGEALGCDPRGPRPAGVVQVDFPASPDRAPRPAMIAEDGWVHLRQDEGGDLAVLVVAGEPLQGVFPPRLARCGVPGRRSVRAFGYPSGFPGGLWATGELIGAGGQSSEWVQLCRQPTSPPIVPGYSGAGVVDELTESVIGCVVASSNSSGLSAIPGIAWMIPLEVIASYWAPLMAFLDDLDTRLAAELAVPASTADEQHLAWRLMAVELIRDRRSRELCIQRLRWRLHQPLPLRSHEDEFDDVRSLARACLSVPGLMAELLDLLIRALGETSELTELAKTAASLLPVPLLSRDERNDLYMLLDGVRLVGTELIYRESVGTLGKPLRTRTGELAAILQQLEDASYGPEGVPPLLHFLRRVADQLPSATSEAVREWITKVAGRLDIAGDKIMVPSPSPSSAQGGANPGEEQYIITDLAQDLLEPDRYRVTIWLQAAGQEHVVGGGDDELINLDEVPVQLDIAVTSLSPDVTSRQYDRTYEFILPRHLLGYPVDQWRIGPSYLSYRFAMGAPVIVRSQDRLRDQHLQHHWHSKWRWLRMNGSTAGPEAVYWMDNRLPMATESVLSLLVGHDQPVCVIFRHPPAADPGEDVLMAALLGGIPAMIWCRDAEAAEKVVPEIQQLLAKGGLGELPERVRLLRNQAIRDGTAGHAGLSLTLLWDAADRIPRAYRTPTKMGGSMSRDG